MSNLKTFYYPASVDEAIKLLADGAGRTGIIAGGTGFSLSRDESLEALVDITRAGLSYIREDGGSIRIGATTTVQEMAKSKVLEKFAGGVIAEAAKTVASRPVRNTITMGGNIVHLRTWSDLNSRSRSLSCRQIQGAAFPRLRLGRRNGLRRKFRFNYRRKN